MVQGIIKLKKDVVKSLYRVSKMLNQPMSVIANYFLRECLSVTEEKLKDKIKNQSANTV